MRRPALVCLFVGVNVQALQAQRTSGQDWQMWNEVDVAARLAPGVSLTVPLVIRDSFHLSNPQLAGAGPIFDFDFGSHLTLTGGYLFVALPVTGPGYSVHVPLAAVTARASRGRFRFSERNRAEGLIGLPGSPIRYRNKVSIEMALAEGRWVPFLNDEAFYDFSKSAWTQNRLQAGLTRRLSPALALSAFFLERSSAKTDPTSTHAVGVSLAIRLNSQDRNSQKRKIP
jgi:hypothetical protein